MSCTTEVSIDWGRTVVGSVDRLQLHITKDGVAWSGIDSVVLTFEAPDRVTQFSHNMVLGDDATGLWYYDTTVNDLTVPGYWTIGVKVTDGVVVKKYPYPISMYVSEEP